MGEVSAQLGRSEASWCYIPDELFKASFQTIYIFDVEASTHTTIGQ
jgi:hypothetical protein